MTVLHPCRTPPPHTHIHLHPCKAESPRQSIWLPYAWRMQIDTLGKQGCFCSKTPSPLFWCLQTLYYQPEVLSLERIVTANVQVTWKTLATTEQAALHCQLPALPPRNSYAVTTNLGMVYFSPIFFPPIIYLFLYQHKPPQTTITPAEKTVTNKRKTWIASRSIEKEATGKLFLISSVNQVLHKHIV